jgi:hypothetical protein
VGVGWVVVDVCVPGGGGVLLYRMCGRGWASVGVSVDYGEGRG